MSDFVVSLIRTWVPVGIGAVLSWLVAQGLDISEETQTQVVVGLTALVTAIYYGVVRALEQRFPAFGLLLGARKEPTYVPNTAPSEPAPQG